MCNFPSSKNDIFFEKKLQKSLEIEKFALSLHSQSGRNNTTESKGSGALVQLVRIRACHARGQGFESPTHRTKEDNRKVVFFFFVYTPSEDIRLHRKYAARLTPMCASPQEAILAAYRFAITLAVHNAYGLLAAQTYMGLPPRLFTHQALLDCVTSSVITSCSIFLRHYLGRVYPHCVPQLRHFLGDDAL